jgi:hypothetical protein
VTDEGFDLEAAIQVLQRTPEVLAALLRGLDRTWIDLDAGDGSWSPFDIVGHLIHGEKTDWIPRARIILEHGTSKTFEPFDRFAQLEVNRGKTMENLLDELADLRRANLEVLRGMELSGQDLERRGRHPELGEVSLSELLATWVTHDLNHLAQIVRTMARRNAREVGAWRQYLRILEGADNSS